jgi:GT2 family glycosyltransferase
MSVESPPARLLPGTVASVDVGTWPLISQACWLSSDVLLLLITSPKPANEPIEAFAECGQVSVRLLSRSICYRQDEPGLSSEEAKAVLLRLPAGHSRGDSLPVVLRTGGSSLRLDATELAEATVGLEDLIRIELAALSVSAREDLLSFLVAGPGDEPRNGRGSRRKPTVCCSKATDESSWMSRLQFSRNMFAARQALRERLPACVISPAVPQGLSIEAILGIDDRNFYIQGWMHDEQATPTRLTAVSPEGARTEFLPHLFRFRRQDVEEFYGDASGLAEVKHGWIATVELPAPSLLTEGWIFEMDNADGSLLEFSGPSVIHDPATIQDMILFDLSHERLPAHQLRAEHTAPALTRLEERRRSMASIVSIDQHGKPPVEPEVSIVVPLYGRIDFLEHQLAQFVHDQELSHADLIYVLDSPDLADAFRVSAAQLAQLYDIPFRAVVMSHNVGFSGVNNIGASLANGRLLLLLNSDVFPRQPGWLSVMANFYHTTERIGALAPKLLYEDDSIQHAGLYFRRELHTGLWNNEHYYKGMHCTLPAANVARVTPAVSGACLMIDLELYHEIGGLRGMYIKGDYEDSDLCLRLTEHGRDTWYLPFVEMYHLEGQSYPSTTRQITGAYNQWLHTYTWYEEIPKLMERT